MKEWQSCDQVTAGGGGRGLAVSRAGAVKVAAAALLGAAGSALGLPTSADAAATNNTFTATNNGSSDLDTAFQTDDSTQHGYTYGGSFSGTQVGVSGYGGFPVENGVSIGVYGQGSTYGVQGDAGDAGTDGVYGNGAVFGNGVHGVTAAASSHAVVGEHSNGGVAVYGASDSSGVEGPAAVYGVNSGSGPGVSGSGDTGAGVVGSTETGYGVVGIAGEAGGTGVLAIGSPALEASGITAFSNCGTAIIKGRATKPLSSMVVTGVALTANSIVLATPQTSVSDVFVQAVIPNANLGTVKIELNQPVTQHITIGWFAVDVLGDTAGATVSKAE